MAAVSAVIGLYIMHLAQRAKTEGDQHDLTTLFISNASVEYRKRFLALTDSDPNLGADDLKAARELRGIERGLLDSPEELLKSKYTPEEFLSLQVQVELHHSQKWPLLVITIQNPIFKTYRHSLGPIYGFRAKND